MARFVLLLMASIALGGVVYGISGSEQAHTTSQRRAIVRETLDDAVATVLDEAIHPTRRVWKTSTKLSPTFDLNGREIKVDDYHLEEGGEVLAFTLSADVGGEVIQQTSRYRISDPGWPGPVWIDSPYATSTINPEAKIDGSSSEGTRGVLFDATRFDQYRLESVLSLNHLPVDLSRGFESARGQLAPMTVNSGLTSVLDRYKSPAIIDVVGKALNEFGADDVRYNGNTVITNKRTFGAVRGRDDARILHVKGDLTIQASGEIEGGGLLLVEGNLIVKGKLSWGGLVIVRSQEQRVRVDFDDGQVEIRGSLVVDQDAPPPGGHTDLTVNRSLLGTWPAAYGEASGSGSNWRPWYKHTHRIDFTIPEKRTFYFAERGRDRHEKYTAFRESLNALATRSPSEKVYIRFKNARNHGSAVFHLAASGASYDGSVAAGFGSQARQGDGWASASFLPSKLDTLIVDVQSLRLLQHLTNNEVPTSPFWTGGRCADRPRCVGQTEDRDGALTVQIVRDRDDRVVYEASIYWHTKEAGHAENLQELAADTAWREAIRSGTAEYGSTIQAGKDVDLIFESSQIARILNRLRLNTLRLEHLNSYVEEVRPNLPESPGPTTPGPTIPPPTTPPPPRGPVIVCHKGKSKSVNPIALPAHLGHGDTVGLCRGGEGGSGGSGSGGSGSGGRSSGASGRN